MEENSEFEQQEGENETVEEFLDAVYKDLFNPKNRRFMGWNKDENKLRVIRVEDKGSSFVIDWKTNYFGGAINTLLGI